MAKAAGRPKRDESEPPMPKFWQDTERLAGCLAYLEVSEKGPNANLESDVGKAYGAQLQHVHSSVKSFEPSTHKHGKDKLWWREHHHHSYTFTGDREGYE